MANKAQGASEPVHEAARKSAGGRVRPLALWFILWSAMLLVSAGNALARYPILSGERGRIFSMLLATIAGVQLLRGVKFLGRREVVLCAVLLPVFCTSQLVQLPGTMGPSSSNRGFDFSAYYLAGKAISERPAQSLYQLPLFADGRMNLNTEDPASSAWHADAVRYHVPFAAPFLYPPFFAVLMKPFAQLSFASAYVVWNMVTTLLIIGAVLLSLDVGGVKIDGKLALILGVGLFSYFPLLISQICGQIGGLILFLLAAGVWLLWKNRPWLSALCFAVATLIKLTPALAVPVLIFHRRWKWLMAYAVWMLSLLIFSVWQAGWSTHQQFWHEVMPSISCGAPVCTNSSVAAYVQDLFLGHVSVPQSPPLTIPPYACAVSRYVAIAVYCLMLVRFYLRRRDGLLTRDLVIMVLLGIVVSPISWWHHYTIGLLPFIYLWCKMPEKGNLTLLALFLAVGTNIVDIAQMLAVNHAAQLTLAAIIPGLTIALAYRSLAPGREASSGGTRIIPEAAQSA